MSHINSHNYEAYYLDYLEGNLSPENTAQLLLFLENNPQYKDEVDGVAITPLPTESSISLDKSFLYQQIDSTNVEEHIIADLENEISAEDKEELTTYLSSSKEGKELAQRYQKTILPKPSIPYPNKGELKKKKKRAVIYYLVPMASAAAIALFILSFLPSKEVKEPSLSLTVTPKHNTTKKNIRKESPQPDKESIVEKTSVKTTINHQKTTSFHVERTKKDELKSIVTIKDTSSQHVSNQEVALSTNELEVVKDSALLYSPNASEEIIVEQVPTDSISNTPEVITSVEPKTKKKGVETLTIGQWANKTIRNKIFKKKSPSTTPIQGSEVITAVTEKVSKRPEQTQTYQQQNENKKSTFSFSIGKFEFSRTKHR